MESKDKKSSVLHKLRQAKQPLSLAQLMAKLGSQYAERSVRRWLLEMASDGLVEKLGKKRATLYQVARGEAQDAHVGFSVESQKIIAAVREPLYKRAPVAYRDEWLRAYEPNRTFYIPLELRLRLQKVGERALSHDSAGTYAHQIFNRLLIDLSYNSSRLEGNTYSLLETQKLLLEGASAEGKLDGEKIMILNHKEAIRYLVDHGGHLEVSEETICTLHYLLSDGLIDNQYAGKVRSHGVRIGGSTYLPFENKKDLEVRLKRVLKKASMIDNPHEQSLFLLVHVSYLQCFVDVNKRTARLSANIPLIKHNLVPLSFNDVERDDYNSAMIAVYELQSIRPLLDLYMLSYIRTAVAYDSSVQAVGFDEIRVRYRAERRALVRDVIISLHIGGVMKRYVLSRVKKLVPEDYQSSFFEDVMEDLEVLDENRIAGLGVTPAQLKLWIEKRKKGSRA
jgi:fido (protein-threonine AMPylation protein)